MDSEDFKNQVEQGLKSLYREQRVRFAWLCGVRALPFLGAEGHFDFWDTRNRRRYIHAVFYALDYSSHTYAAAGAANAAYDAASAYASDAAFAFASASVVSGSFSSTASASSSSSSAASNAAAAARHFSKDLESIILYDLTRIKTSRKDSTHNCTDWYGEIWNNFQTALEKEGCAYWGQLYKQIFDDGFILDLDALDKRLNIPNEIKEQGAAAV